MPESERAKDKRIRDTQRHENRAFRGLITILKQLLEKSSVYASSVPRSLCPLCGCLLFESDDTCPGCRVAVLAKEGQAA